MQFRQLHIFLLIFVIAFIVRLTAIHFFQTEPFNDLLWNDAVAWNLAQGNGYTASQEEPRIPGIFRTPGYPLFLALVYKIAGHSYYPAYVANALLDSFSALLLGFLGLRYFSSRSFATLSAAAYAIYPYPAMFCPVLHQDILLVFFVLLSLLLLSQACRKQSGGWWFVVGISVGILALIKANMVLFLAVPALTLLFVRPEIDKKPKQLLVMIFGVVLTIAPWVIRNYMVFHSFPPLAVGGTGRNLMYLVTEVEGGEEALLKSFSGGPPPSRDLTYVGDGVELIEYEKRLAKEAIPILLQNWPRYAIVILEHIPRLWISKYSVWHSGYVQTAGRIISFMVLIPGLIGMSLLRKKIRILLPLYLTIIIMTLMYAPYTVEARYTLPARPIMVMFVMVTIFRIFRKPVNEKA